MVSIGPYHQSTLLPYRTQVEVSPPTGFVPPANTILGLLLKNPEFSTFLALVRRTRMEGELSYVPNNLTIFMPPNSSLKGLNLDQIDTGTAITIVKMHIVNGRFGSDVLQATAGANLVTRYGKIHVETENGITNISLNESPMGLAMSAPQALDAAGKVIPNVSGSKKVKVLYFNIEVDNGLIHVTDGLLFV